MSLSFLQLVADFDPAYIEFFMALRSSMFDACRSI
jgi:hypothetical protein